MRIPAIVMITALELLLLAGCAARKSEPFVPVDSAGSRFLIAVGSGQSEGEARNQARAEMSRIFESRVYSDTYDRLTAVIESSGAETSRQQIESQVRVVSDVDLKGMEIEETWQEDAQYYARAVLDRYKARDDWIHEINNMDKVIAGRLNALGSLQSSLFRLRSLIAVSGQWVEREVLVSRLNVLGFGYSGFPEYDIREVFRSIAETRKSMPVYIKVEGEHGPRIKGKVSEELGRRGYVITENPAEASVRITGSASVKPVEIGGSDLRYARAVVALQVADAEAGLSVGEVSENKRAAHLTYREAVERALRKVAPLLAETLVKFMEEEDGVQP